MQNTKKILILANIIIGLLIYFSWENEDYKKDNISDVLVSVLPTLEQIKIQDFESNKSIQLYNEAEGWIINSPVIWPANGLKLSNFKTKIAHLEIDKLYEVNELKKRGEILEDYGINERSSTISLNSNLESINFSIGEETRDGENRYVVISTKQLNRKILYKVSKEITDLSRSALSEWSVKNFIKTPLYGIERISVKFLGENNQTNITTLSRDQKEWKFKEPFDGLADSEKVMILLNGLISSEVLDLQIPTKKRIDLNWNTELEIDGFGKKEIYNFKPYNLNNTNYIIGKECNEETQFILSSDFMSMLNDWSSNLRNRLLFNLSLNEIKHLRIKTREEEIMFSKNNEEKWKITESNNSHSLTMPSDINELSAFYRSFSSIEIDQFLDTSISTEDILQYNMDSPLYEIDILTEDNESISYCINRTDNENRAWTIMDKTRSFICMVQEDFEKVLGINMLKFRDKRLFKKEFSPTKISILKNDDNRSLSITRISNPSLLKVFENFSVEDYCESKYMNDGTWINGDWVPWKYKIYFLDKNNTDLSYSFRLSERKGATTWYGGDPLTKLTFNLTIPTIDELEMLISSDLEKLPNQN